MSSRPLREFKLKNKLEKEKPFLLQVRKAQTNSQLRFLITNASDQRVRLLQSLVMSYFGDPPQTRMPSKTADKLLQSGRYAFVKKHFQPTKKLNSLAEARSLLLKIVSPLKILVSNILSTKKAR